MKIYLKNWNNRNEVIMLDVDAGSFTKLTPENEMNHSINGIGAKIGDSGNNICAVYTRDNCIWLQFNSHKWNTNVTKIRIKHRRFLFFEVIKIFSNKKNILKKTIKSSNSFMNLLTDPTTDHIDEDNEYFLRWLSKVLNSEPWIESFKKKYSGTA